MLHFDIRKLNTNILFFPLTLSFSLSLNEKHDSNYFYSQFINFFFSITKFSLYNKIYRLIINVQTNFQQFFFPLIKYLIIPFKKNEY